MRKLALIASVALCGSAFAQTVVYNARDGQPATVAGILMAEGATTSTEWGDEATLTGTERTVTQLAQTLQFNNGTGDTSNFNLIVTTRLRSMLPDNTPGTILWEQAWSISNTAAGAYFYTFTVPNVVVPDTVVFSFQFSRQATSNIGAALVQAHNSAPLIGSSSNTYFWGLNQTTNAWQQLNFGATPQGNFRGRITAVPEPASMAALAFGAAALISRRRRRS
jgi:hypothetical protein